MGRDHVEGDDKNLARERLPFTKFFEIWIDMKREQGLSEKTLYNYKNSATNYLLPCLQETALGDAHSDHARNITKACKDKGLSIGITNFHLRVLKQIFSDAVRFKYLHENPFALVKPIKERPKSLSYWLPEEAQKFLSANANNPLYALFTVALYTGLRRGELAGLCWDKVNLKNGWIEVARVRDRYGLRDTTKTGLIRHVPLKDAAHRALEKLKQGKKGKFVFTLNGSVPSVEHFSGYCFKKAVKVANVPSIRFHDLRTTFASNFVMAGGDVFTLSKLLGHTSVDMTTKKYAALHPRFIKEAIQNVPIYEI